MKKVFYSKIALLFLSTYLIADSGTYAFGEFIDIKEVNGFKANDNSYKIRMIYNVRGYSGSIIPTWQGKYNDLISDPNNLKQMVKNRSYENIILDNVTYAQLGGLGWSRNDKELISSGLIGKTNSIYANEDILFSLIPYRDRSHMRTADKGDHGANCLNSGMHRCEAFDKFFDVVGQKRDFQAAEMAPYTSDAIYECVMKDGRCLGIHNAFRLIPYYQNINAKDGPARNYPITLENKADVSIKAYVQKNEGSSIYITLSNELIDSNGNYINPYNDSIKFISNVNSIIDSKDLELSNENFLRTMWYSSYVNKLAWKDDWLKQYSIIGAKYDHQIIYPTLFTNWDKSADNNKSVLNYAIKTFKKCKQALLYKIQIHAAKIKGAKKNSVGDNEIFSIYNDGNANDGYKNYYGLGEYADVIYDDNDLTKDTPIDNGIGRIEGGKKELRIGVSEPAIFFVLQEGSKDDDAIDCLPAPKSNITSAWLLDENNKDFTYSNTKAGNSIYTILNGDTAYVRLDFSTLNADNDANKPKNNPFSNVTNINNFNESDVEFRYISIDAGDVRTPLQCANDNPYKLGDLKYFSYTYSNLHYPADYGQSTSDNERLNGKFGLTYQEMCNLVNTINKKQTCDPNIKSNKIFFKYADATIRFNCLTTSMQDKARREFKIRFYRDIREDIAAAKDVNGNIVYDENNEINDGGKIIKHIPITVRPKSMNIKDIHSCAIFTNCFPNENIGSQTEQLSSNNTIYHDGVSYVFVIGEYKLKVFDSKGNPYYFNIAQGSKNANAISYPNNTRNIPATGRSHNLTIINPFATTNANVIVKEEHIRKFLDEFKAKNNEFKDYKYTDSCIDNNEYVDKITANTAIEHKIYCQTPLEREISPKITGVTNKFIIKDNIDKDARANVFITSNPEEFKYRIYPQIQSLAANDINVSRYFPKALNIELKLNFNDSVKDENKLNLDFDNETFIGNEYRAFSTSSKVEKNNFSFNVELDSEALNQNYDTALKEASDICKDDCTTSWLIDKTTNKKYAHIEKNKAITEELRYNARLAQANDNAVEIPLALTYTKKQNALRLDSLDFIIDETKNNNSSFTSTKIKENIPVNTLFVSAVAMFKDKKADTGAKKANMNTNDVWLHYIDKGGIFRPFAYLKTDNKSDDWKITKAELDNKKQIDCDDNTPCYRILNSSNEVPGLEDKIKYSSDYQSSVKLLKVGTRVSGLEIELNNDMKKLQYVKDTIHCYGGLFNCDSRWTVEFIK